MSSTLVSARVPDNLAKRLDDLAKTMHRSKSFLAAQAIEEFVDLQEYHVQAIKEGIAAVERGDVVSHEQAVAVLKSWGKRG
ncbi:MAG: CopG family ribbon-helix-helix protein [Desulfobulbaceae bacterium]|nr:CopG family ribbon-helix-helix protein [Desulfobulbaceae bacterium]